MQGTFKLRLEAASELLTDFSIVWRAAFILPSVIFLSVCQMSHQMTVGLLLAAESLMLQIPWSVRARLPNFRCARAVLMPGGFCEIFKILCGAEYDEDLRVRAGVSASRGGSVVLGQKVSLCAVRTVVQSCTRCGVEGNCWFPLSSPSLDRQGEKVLARCSASTVHPRAGGSYWSFVLALVLAPCLILPPGYHCHELAGATHRVFTRQ